MSVAALCVDCAAVFESAPDDDTFVAYICEKAPDCCCEVSSVSAFSNQAVGSDETLVRLVVDDTHIKRAEDGTVVLRESFLSDLSTYGSSTLRLGRATVAEFKHQVNSILEAGRFKADGTPREIIGYVRISVEAVRKLQVKQKKDEAGNEPLTRACAAYDTGLEEAPNHADLMLNSYQKLSNGGRVAAVKGVGNAVRGGFVAVNSIDEILALGV